MIPFDVVTPLHEALKTIPVVKSAPALAQDLFAIGMAVHGVLYALRRAIVGKKPDAESTKTHPADRFMGRFGPIVNAGIGLAIGLLTTFPVWVGFTGGALSSYTFALWNKTVWPLVQKAFGMGKAA